MATRKLSYKEQRELEALPAMIEALEAEQAILQATVHSPSFYKESKDVIAATLARLADVERDVLGALERWDALESRRK